ncbi:MAG: acyl-CoA dehydrogenase family protein, partial [Caulobacteraceae bacterium]
MTYKPPIEDLRFALATAGYDRLAAFFPAADEATSRQVLEAAGALAEKVLAPLNHSGDEEGSRLENGRVAAPAGFKEAYRAFAEGGWTGLTADSEVGGQGLPRALQSACYEMFQAANMAFALCPTLSLAAIDALMAHGEESQRRRFLPRLVSGEWTGTMNLTEPQAGSDLGAIRTRAQSDGEGHWRLTGEKIFITWGDHDLADNIVHMVLARLPDSPPGTRGLSLFAVPARLVGEDGEAGEANALVVASIEKKLGIHASPTCVMRYEGAAGELVGTPHQGLAAMFTMMNAARLQVGVQGVG